MLAKVKNFKYMKQVIKTELVDKINKVEQLLSEIQAVVENEQNTDKYAVASTGCWVWLGALDKDGYPRNGKHRKYYQEYVGSVPDGYILDHTCNRRDCVNPAHLEPVTNLENIRRGRVPKLSVEEVLEIKTLLVEGMPQIAIARLYGVTPPTISAIARGITWTDIIP